LPGWWTRCREPERKKKSTMFTPHSPISMPHSRDVSLATKLVDSRTVSNTPYSLVPTTASPLVGAGNELRLDSQVPHPHIICHHYIPALPLAALRTRVLITHQQILLVHTHHHVHHGNLLATAAPTLRHLYQRPHRASVLSCAPSCSVQLRPASIQTAPLAPPLFLQRAPA
jgi:hypothetical protein